MKSTEIDYFAELFLIVISRTLIRPAYLEGRFGLSYNARVSNSNLDQFCPQLYLQNHIFHHWTKPSGLTIVLVKWDALNTNRKHSACKTHDFRLNPLKQGLSFYCGLSFYFWRTMWLYSHSQCIACKMSIFSVITPFVYNIWRVMPKEAAIWMRLYELQRMNGKSIISFWYDRDEVSLLAFHSLNSMFFFFFHLLSTMIVNSLWWINHISINTQNILEVWREQIDAVSSNKNLSVYMPYLIIYTIYHSKVVRFFFNYFYSAIKSKWP